MVTQLQTSLTQLNIYSYEIVLSALIFYFCLYSQKILREFVEEIAKQIPGRKEKKTKYQTASGMILI